MAYARPTLKRLISRVQGDLNTYLQNGAARVRRSVEYALSRVVAGLAYGLHGHVHYVSRQVVPDDECDDDWILRHARAWGITPNPPTTATFEITVTGSAGAAIPADTEWASADGEATYTNATAGVIPASAPLETTVTVTATEAGADGNAEGGATLTLTTPVADVDADATVVGALGELQGGGDDEEAVSAVRVRLRERIQSPPSGGGPGDYIAWAKTVSGVTRAWELPGQLGPSTVVVLFVSDAIDSDGNFESTTFPGESDVAEVQAVLDAKAPVIAVPTAATPLMATLDPVISLSPNTADVRAEVEAQLNDLLLRKSGPRETILLSDIRDAVGLAPSVVDYSLTAPVTDVVSAATEVYVLGSPTYSELT